MNPQPTDLLGRETVARAPAAPFYCCGCSGTQARFCVKHQRRHCASGKARCQVGFCEDCDLELPAAAAIGGAILSPCGRYRYVLRRSWSYTPDLVVVMLNPSTADARTDDPTIRRCMGFARRDGFGGLVVLNLFAWRAAKPAALLADGPDRVGPDNDWHLTSVAESYPGCRVLCAWGAHRAATPERVGHAVRLLQRHGATLLCLGRTASGAPRHPLYVRGDAAMEPFDG